MKGCYLEKWLLVGSVLYALFSSNLCVAQVVGDTTLPTAERSLVTGNPNFQIDGGATRGGNLFHSFQSFSVPTGGSAYFNNAADVQNIFSRVTGGSISNIDGVIRANGTANLFLLNPNGILFGAGASLNIGGSFVASTANSINFADNFQYSATNPQTTPLLTVSVPIGLQLGTNPGAIVVQGNGYDLSIPVPIFLPLIRGTSSTGLQVPAGRTLALIGGDIELIGGTLTAEQGRIELGSVRDGQVSLDGGFALSYPGVQTFGDIRLSQQALADASGSGLIQVQGNQVSLVDGSLLLIQNQEAQAGGSITVNAAQSLEVSGTSSDGRIYGGLDSQSMGVGSGADIAVSTRQLAVRDGATIVARSYSSARTGNVTTQASDSVQVIGVSSINPSLVSNIATAAFSSGDAGDVTVSTQELTILITGTIGSATFGRGRGGDVTVNALDSIKLAGQSILFTQSTIQANSLGAGDAGRVTVNTSRLVIQDGGAVTTSTGGTGSAGSLTINASESVEVSGRPPVPSLPSYVGSSAVIASDILKQTFRLPPTPSGFSGNVTINTQRLSVTDGATVEVSNQGVGNGGTLTINANSIFLDSRGAITAATASGEGGDIDLNVRDVLLLRNNSQITTSAAGTGNGGNIRINTSSLVAVPNENSDISADSVNARSGNVTINTSGLFGIEFRDRNTPLSDITATGASSELSGTVQINVQDVDPARGLAQLPTDVVDASGAIATGCRNVRDSSFVVTGRGGLPPNPEQQLDDDAEWLDRRRLTVAQQTNPGTDGSQQHSEGRLDTPHSAHHPPLIEATGWELAPTGQVILTASVPNVTSSNRWGQPVNCNGS
ncbi:MAG: S-layer family protein [Symplocastrum torsivum CPER-KK1]|jgi:filamentous hemagglutinin family protein|uniref:S-layer family protein n=1 Tax=Symplocastrum torsivum CPER-KK1 TaxID=450513 RepID=A0A951PR36_9CYAN|nr:S-layer family protein [Symplocastrum torsivum CPER-KK1]